VPVLTGTARDSGRILFSTSRRGITRDDVEPTDEHSRLLLAGMMATMFAG
jgi:hypothetical protein